MCVAWPFNGYGYLDLYWADLGVRRWRFPMAPGFSAAMKDLSFGGDYDSKESGDVVCVGLSSASPFSQLVN